MAKLVAETGEFAGAEYPIGAKPLVLGRLKSNDIEVRDTKASRKHTRVGRAGGVWIVEDLKSSNGTFLNGEKIEARMPLHAGDTIAIGQTVYRFEPEDDVAAATAPARRSAPAEPTPRPAPAPDPVAEEPEELSLEEPEELGLDAGEAPAPAAPAAPAAPSAPAAPRPAVRGQALVSINSVQKASRTGLLGEDIAQRGALFQGLVYLGGAVLFCALVYGAYALAVGAMGDGPDEIPVDETAPADENGG
jgi:hypothetical protein